MTTRKRISGAVWCFIVGAGITLFLGRFMLDATGFLSMRESNIMLIAGISTFAAAGLLAAVKRVDWSII